MKMMLGPFRDDSRSLHYNQTCIKLQDDEAVFRSTQVFTINTTSHGHPDGIHWPLMSFNSVAPRNGANSAVAGGCDSDGLYFVNLSDTSAM